MGDERRLIKHVKSNPFVGLSAFAASVHTAWAFGTLFSGAQPHVTASLLGDFGAWSTQSIALCLWLLPAIALAIALDVGMVETSMNIHQGDVSIGRYATFAALASGSYYMQMLHLAVHMPELQLSTAVAPMQESTVLWLRNAAVFIVPLLLQLPILLHVMSVKRSMHTPTPSSMVVSDAQRHEHLHVHMDGKQAPQAPMLPEQQAKALPAQARTSPRGNANGEAASMVHPTDDGLYALDCVLCGQHKDGYKSEASAMKAAAAHIGLWCKARQEQKVDAL